MFKKYDRPMTRRAVLSLLLSLQIGIVATMALELIVGQAHAQGHRNSTQKSLPWSKEISNKIKSILQNCSPEVMRRYYPEGHRFFQEDPELVVKKQTKYHSDLSRLENKIAKKESKKKQLQDMRENLRQFRSKKKKWKHHFPSKEEVYRQRDQQIGQCLPTLPESSDQQKRYKHLKDLISALKKAERSIDRDIQYKKNDLNTKQSQDFLHRRNFNLLPNWDPENFTSTLDYQKDQQYQFIVHGIVNSSQGEALIHNLDLLNKNHFTMSVSLVTNQKNTTVVSTGIILEVPQSLLYASLERNMFRLGASADRMNKKFGLQNPDDVINRSSHSAHNELTILSHDPHIKSQLGVSGLFISTRNSWGNSLSMERLEQVERICLERKIPVILLQDH